MDTEILNEKQPIECHVDDPQEGIDKEKYGMFINVLENSNFLDRITEKTSLKWVEPTFNVKYANEADFEGLDTVSVNYNRGARAVSSATHESFHLMLRQIKWTENPVVMGMVEKYPRLINSSAHGVGYKMEQMFAYLLQNEIYQEIGKDMGFDASKDYWSKELIVNDFLPYEFDSPFLEKLALSVIDVWYSPNRSKDIFEMIKEVDRRM